MMGEIITAAEARELLAYDPDTGILTWRVSRGRMRAGQEAGSLSPQGKGHRRNVSVNGRSYKAHRLAWLIVHGEWPEGRLDHRNGDASKNRLGNLRPATQQQNMRNRRAGSHNESGLKGVSKAKSSKSDRWYARIDIGGQVKCLGSYGSPEEAHEAYLKAEAEHFGDFARGRSAS